MKCISVNIVILGILLLMQSCIEEDIHECNDSSLRLKFRYILNNQYSDLFASEVHQVKVYLFDAKEKYIGTFSESGDKLTSNYIMTIPVPEGEYQAVVFCDNLNTFSVGWVDASTGIFYNDLKQGITTSTDFRILINSKEGKDNYLIPESVPGDLYAGYVTNAISSHDTSSITDVDLMKDTKTIKVKISGLSLLTRSEITPEIFVTAINGRYKKDNSIDTSHRMLKYTPHNISVIENVINCDLRTMRLVTGHAPMLVIKNPSTSENVFNRDITELILSNPKYVSQKDIDREDTFIFEVNFSQPDKDIIVSISINGWIINNVTPVND